MNPLNFKLTIQELDFLVNRLTAGTMDYATSQNVSAMLQKLQQQANDPELNPKIALVETTKEAKNG